MSYNNMVITSYRISLAKPIKRDKTNQVLILLVSILCVAHSIPLCHINEYLHLVSSPTNTLLSQFKQVQSL